MLNHTRLKFADTNDDAVRLLAFGVDALDDWLESQPQDEQAWIKAQGFKAAEGTICTVPADGGAIAMALAGLGDAQSRARGRFTMASIAAKLPAGTYQLVSDHAADDLEEHALGWLLSQYAFEAYRAQPPHGARLVCPDGVNKDRIESIAAGETLTRDLINTPASDMGPADLEAACAELAGQHDAQITVIRGEALLEQNFPMIHTVGRAADQCRCTSERRCADTGPAD